MTPTEPRSDQTELSDAQRRARTAQPAWTKALVFGATALVLLLLGGAAGIWITLARSESPASPGPSGTPPSAVDVGFAQDMSTHHLQAVQMSNVERDNSRDRLLRQLAFDIEQGQLEQVGRMKGFLSMWGEPEQGVAEERMVWMSAGDHGGHGMSGMRPDENGLMPGMATTAELADLRTKSGEALDVRFLQLMLRHHQGGIPMAEYALENARNSAVRQLARSMVRTQQSEVDLMTRLLAERDSRPLPFP